MVFFQGGARAPRPPPPPVGAPLIHGAAEVGTAPREDTEDDSLLGVILILLDIIYVLLLFPIPNFCQQMSVNWNAQTVLSRVDVTICINGI